MNPSPSIQGPQTTAPGNLGIHRLWEQDESTSICSVVVDDRLYGIDTRKIREVLGNKKLERVPLAPAYIGGVVSYRGDVLTVVSFRALLGLAELPGPGYVLVFKSAGEEESSGLLVDSVSGVVILGHDVYTPNPSTLDPVGKALFSGAFRLDKGLLIQLDPERLRPSRLAETALFQGRSAAARQTNLPVGTTGFKDLKEQQCER